MSLSQQVQSRVDWYFSPRHRAQVAQLLLDCEAHLEASYFADCITAETLQLVLLQASAGDVEKLQNNVALVESDLPALLQQLQKQPDEPSEFFRQTQQAQLDAQRRKDADRDWKIKSVGNADSGSSFGF